MTAWLPRETGDVTDGERAKLEKREAALQDWVARVPRTAGGTDRVVKKYFKKSFERWNVTDDELK